MATTEHFYTGNNSTTDYSFSFPYLKTADIKVALDAVATTAYTLPNATTVRFNTAPGQDVDIHIYRDTEVDSAKATYAAGSSVRAVDLNNNEDQALYSLQEHQGQLILTADIRDAQITSGKILDATIVNNDINASAAIAGTKVSPDFGSQNIATTGTINGVTTTEVAILDGATVTTNELNILDGVTASTAELNIMDGVTATTAEINHVDGVTSNVQTQLDGKQSIDSELTTLIGMQSGTASILASGTALTATTAELNLLDGKSIVTSISGSSTDVQLPTAKAVNDQIVSLTQGAGGFYPIDDELKFPNTNPDPNDDAGTIVSIADAGGIVVNGSGVSTTGRTLGGSTVTINGIDSSLYDSTIAPGKGMLVQTTSTLNTYTYHRLVVDEAGVANAQTLVSDFNERYRVGSSNPSTSLDDGDLFFNTDTGKMLVYNDNNTAWEEVQSIGNFYISTFSEAFDGSRIDFTLSNAPTNAQQVILSINGVIQKPNSSTSRPSEGFSLNGSTLQLPTGSGPANGTDYWVVVMGSTVNIGTPSNNTVTNAILQSGCVDNAKVATNAAIAGSKLADDSITEDKLVVHNAPSGTDKFLAYTSNGMEWAVPTDTNTQVGGATGVDFNDGVKGRFGTDNDLEILHTGTHAQITNATGRIDITSSANDVIFYTDQIQFKNAANSATMAWFEAGGECALKFNNATKIQTNSGGITVTGTVTETSDIALKEDIKPLSNSLSNLKQLNGYSYKFKETGIKALGLTAQDVEKVYPDLVSGEEGQKGLNYSGLIAPLIEAIKQLSAEIETLKTKVAALEAK